MQRFNRVCQPATATGNTPSIGGGQLICPVSVEYFIRVSRRNRSRSTVPYPEGAALADRLRNVPVFRQIGQIL